MLISSAQDECIRTSNIKTTIDGPRNDPICRMCKANNETITHIISDCPKLIQNKYKRRHDRMGRAVHWDICRKKSFNFPEKWYKHKPLPCRENKSFKILWDFVIQTGNIIQYNIEGQA